MSEAMRDEILNPPAPGKIAKTRADVLAEMERESKNRNYAIPFRGVEFSFSYPSKTSEIDMFTRLAKEFADRMKETKSLPPAYKNILGIRDMDGADFVNAYTIHYWSDPEQEGGKIDEIQALALVAYDPGGCTTVVNVIESFTMGKSNFDFSKGVFAAKKN